MKRNVKKLYTTKSINKDEKDKEYTQKKKNAVKQKRKNSLCTSKAKEG